MTGRREGVGHGAGTFALSVLAAYGWDALAELRAGRDTAEWAHERADARPTIKHTLAPVFDAVQAPGDDFVTHRYVARVPLGTPSQVSRVELSNLTAGASIILSKATLYDSATGRAHPLRNDPEILAVDPARWRVEHSGGDMLVLRNARCHTRGSSRRLSRWTVRRR